MRNLTLKTWFLLAAFLTGAVLVAMTGLVLSRSEGSNGSSAVAEVNGDVITASELQHFARMHRASVIESFTTAFEATYDEAFWMTEYSDDAPIETLRDRALDDAIRMKLELRLVLEQGIVESVSYEGLIEQMDRENERRAAAVARGEPIYGPVRFEEDTFVDFYRSKINTVLKEMLAADELEPSEQELMDYYERVIPDLLPTQDRLVYDQYTIIYRTEGRDEDQSKEAARLMAERVRAQMQDGTAIDMNTSAPAPELSASYERALVLDEANASRMFKAANALYAALRESAISMKVSVVLDDVAEGRYLVVKVQERESAEPASFAETRDLVRKLYLEEAFERHIDTRVSDSDILRLPALEEQMLAIVQPKR